MNSDESDIISAENRIYRQVVLFQQDTIDSIPTLWTRKENIVSLSWIT